VDRFVEYFLAISGPWAVSVVFFAPALETALVLGLVLPGELTVVLGGVLAGRGQVPLAAVLVASVAGAIAGDVTGYLLGRRYGQEIVRRRLKSRWTRAHGWLSKKGGGAVFLGRFLPFLRSVLPTTAGAMRVPARRFFLWDIPAAVIWGAASTLLGYFAALDVERVFDLARRFSLVLLAVALVAVTLVIWRRRTQPRRRAARGVS
jgi:membrane-associated protein